MIVGAFAGFGGFNYPQNCRVFDGDIAAYRGRLAIAAIHPKVQQAETLDRATEHAAAVSMHVGTSAYETMSKGEAFMSSEVQRYLSEVTRKAATDLIAVIDGLPDDKRGWSPMSKGRSALDQAAECAMLNESVTAIIASHKFDENFDFAKYDEEKKRLATDWTGLKELLMANAGKLAVAIETTPDSDLRIEVVFPWGPMSMESVLGYPFWNMSYHLGQVNYIGFLAA